MKTAHVIILTAVAAAIAAASPMLAQERDDAQRAKQENSPAQRPGGGALGTLPHGTYQCALPGDVAGKAYEVVEDEQFRIGAASKYRNAQGTGAYLLRGDELIFTRGPKAGERFKRISTNQLRKLDGQQPTDLLCTRLGSAN